MKNYSRPHRSRPALLRDASAHAQQERDGRDKLVVDIAEIDARQVYREAGYPSAVTYCMAELELSKKAALHRIHVGRVAWRLPAILAALTEGRLHLTAVSMLAAHLTEDNVDELVAVAEGMTKHEIRQLIAKRFPRRDLFNATEVLSSESLLLGAGEDTAAFNGAETQRRLDGVGSTCAQPEPEERERRPDGVRVAAPIQLPPPRFPLKLSLRQETHEKLRHARDLLGHQVPSGDVAEVLDRALDALITTLEKRKFGATDRPRAGKPRKAAKSRYIPAEVRRAVHARDGGQCTFTNDTGKRCPARKLLEFDHIVEFARGGQSTADNIRLRCRAHNQLTAERTYGAERMQRKREDSREARARVSF